MMDYIDREKVIDVVTDYCIDNSIPSVGFASAILGIPAAKVKEVKYGKWIRPTTVGGILIAGLPHCSVCGEVPCDEGKYCPNCGAEMEVKDEQKQEESC